MKRKIFSILFALVLVASFSLVTAVPVAAATIGAGIPASADLTAWQSSDDPVSGGDGLWYCNAALAVDGAGTLTNWDVYVNSGGSEGELAQLAVIRPTSGGGGEGPALSGCTLVGLGPSQAITGDGLNTFTLAGSSQEDGVSPDANGIVVQAGDYICANSDLYSIGVDFDGSPATGGLGPEFNVQYLANLDKAEQPFDLADSSSDGTLMIRAWGYATAAATIDLAVNDQNPWTSEAFTFTNVSPGEDLASFPVKFENVGTDPGTLTFSISYEESDIEGAPAPDMDADEFASLVYVAAVSQQYFGGSYPGGGGIHDDELENWLVMDGVYGNNDGKLSLHELMLASPIPWATTEGDTLPAGEASEFVITFCLGDSLEPFEAGGAILTGVDDNRAQGDGISVTVSATLKSNTTEESNTEQSSGNVFQAAGVAGPVLNVDTDVSYGTIQLAIDDAGAGDTITVAAGTYEAFEIIGKSGGITVRGVDDPVVSIPVEGMVALVSIASSSGIIKIEGLTIDATGTNGILAEGTGGTIIAILGNTITGFTKYGIVVKDVPEVHIEVNNVSTPDNSIAATNGIQVGYSDPELDPTPTTGTVKGNQVSGCQWGDYDPEGSYEYTSEGEGFYNWTASGILVIAPNSGLVISENEVHSCDVGLDVEVGSETVIKNNDVHDNSYGIVSWNAKPIINFNDIYQNALCGVYRTEDLGGELNAKVNWWGDISGPQHETTWGELPPITNPGGTGDKVSDNVKYLPWLTRDFQTVIDDNIAYFGFPTVYLNAGWRTLSTPIALDAGDGTETYPGCNTWGKYKALGDGLNLVPGVVNAYSYDAGASPPRFVPVASEDELKPCDAIYVRMAEPDIAAILLSPDVSAPSKDLYAGWNLVGPSLSREVSCLPVDVALSTVYTVTGDLTGYNLVVSPPGNQHAWFFVRDSEEAVDEECYWGEMEECMWQCGEDPYCLEFCMEVCSEFCSIPLPSMCKTEGYWVFMINPGTLAGSGFTPIPLD